jgi:protein TonB
METKKTPQVNLENYRGIFIFVGLLVAFLAVYFVLNINKTKVENDITAMNDNVVVDDDMVAITRPKTPEPPKIQHNKQISSDIIKIVKIGGDDFKIIDEGGDPVEFDSIGEIEEPIVIDEPPVVYAETMPEFPGGEKSLLKYIAENTKYPQLAIDNDVQGTVSIRFVVSKTGKVTNVEIFKGIDPLLDQEALRVVKSLPDFKPGMQGGRAVSVSMVIPIVFQLDK